MFRIEKCVLTVKDGEMTAAMTLSGDGYEKLYMGTGEQALTAGDDNCYYFVEGDDGKYTYTVPIKGLEIDVNCAALSIRKQQWYDRVLVFHAPNSEYAANVTLTGGSGRATIESPAKLKIAGGQYIATLVWSSKNYDYMIVDGEKYLPVTTEPTAAFEVPVRLDEDMEIIADTVAMSEPHEIEYTLRLEEVRQ
jgi:hypothetical protein